jgi:sugar-specific transcriptional regulator TrmB
MTTNQPEGTHIERLRAALDDYKIKYEAALDELDDMELPRSVDWLIETADVLADRVGELLAEIEHIKGGGEPTDRI